MNAAERRRARKLARRRTREVVAIRRAAAARDQRLQEGEQASTPQLRDSMA